MLQLKDEVTCSTGTSTGSLRQLTQHVGLACAPGGSYFGCTNCCQDVMLGYAASFKTGNAAKWQQDVHMCSHASTPCCIVVRPKRPDGQVFVLDSVAAIRLMQELHMSSHIVQDDGCKACCQKVM